MVSVLTVVSVSVVVDTSVVVVSVSVVVDSDVVIVVSV